MLNFLLPCLAVTTPRILPFSLNTFRDGLMLMSLGTWVASAVAASAVVGAGATMYGANKQAKASAEANRLNKEAQDETNRLQWAQYLMQRGINPGSNVTPGVIPQNAPAMNTKLPIWATVRRPASRDGARVRLTGTARG